MPNGRQADRGQGGGKDWERHLGQSESLFVNASAWGLMLTGRFVDLGRIARSDVGGYLKKLVTRSGEPIIRNAMRQAMRIMGKQFVLGRTIDEALSIAAPLEADGYRFSYDMLGEAAFTMEDAHRYFASYQNALKAVGAKARGDDVFARASISVKLSALHPRYEEKQEARVMAELLPRVAELAAQAKALNVGLTIDAEEVNRLDLSLELFGRLAQDPRLAGWNGLGLAVQAYSKRAKPVLEWLAAVAQGTGRVLPVRLVKGAYWDTEVKRAQEQGLPAYPLFTRKVSTDVSYLACARYLLARRDVFYPQFATHNAHSLAAISVMAGNDRRFEFQRLHGMGQALYEQVVGKDKMNQPCRIYAPVGSHEDLLAYLVRRLLENGGQHLLREPAGRRRGADCRHHRRSGDRGGQAQRGSASEDPAAGQHLSRPRKFQGCRAVGRCHAKPPDGRHGEGAGETLRGACAGGRQGGHDRTAPPHHLAA